MYSMTDINSLSNSFGTTFGLHGTDETYYDKENNRDVHILKLTPDEHLSEEKAKQVFELVTKAFKIGSNKHFLQLNQLSFIFDKDNLTITQYKQYTF